MARRRPDGSPIWPCWYYSPDGEGKICQSPSDVPDGWKRKRGDAPVTVEAPPPIIYDRNELVAELTRLGIEINPIWGTAHMKRIIDGDVSPTR